MKNITPINTTYIAVYTFTNMNKKQALKIIRYIFLKLINLLIHFHLKLTSLNSECLTVYSQVCEKNESSIWDF